MARKKLDPQHSLPPSKEIVDQLKKQILDTRESGQPLIYEQELGSDRWRVTVVWDKWQGLPLEDRTSAILAAYQAADSSFRNRIALASGLTVPEATAAGLLPWQVGTAWRPDDPVTFGDCRQAMLEEGASTLFGPNILQLRFATREEAEDCRQRLIKRLSKSEKVWIISADLSVQDHLTLQEAASSDG